MTTQHIDDRFAFFRSIDWNAYTMKHRRFRTTLGRLPDGHVFPHGSGGHDCGHEDCPANSPNTYGKELPIASHAEAHGY